MGASAVMIPPVSARAGAGSLVDQAVRAVTDHIRDNGLRVGDTLPGEGHFAASLGVSRAVIREAFGALAALRLIDVANGRKAKVGAIDGSVIASSLSHAVSTAQITVPEVWDVRRTIERRTAALAADCRTSGEADRIVDLAEKMAEAAAAFDQQGLEAMTVHDVAFHDAIARASHNALFVQIVASFAPLMQIAVPAAWRTRQAQSQRAVMIARHKAIAESIRQGDSTAAAAAMDEHFDVAVGSMLHDVAQGPAPSIPQ